MGEINNQVIGLVKDELNRQCQSLIELADEWQTQRRLDDLEAFRQLVAELRGVTSILALKGANQGFDTLLEYFDKSDLTIDHVIDDITSISTTLCHYLVFSLQRCSDNPLLILPELNRLREAIKKPLLTESTVLSAQVSHPPLVVEADNYPADKRLVIRRARHMYQQGLLHAIKGSSKAGAFRILGHAVRRVQQTCTKGGESDYWLILLQVLDAFAKRTLSLDKSRLRNLMVVERQMRVLMSDKVTLAAAYPEPIQKQMMILFLLSGPQAPQAVKLAERLALTPLQFTDQNISADRSLFGSKGIHSFADTMSVIKDEKDSMSFFLERLEKNEYFDEMDRQNLFNNLLTIAEVASVSGLAIVSSRFFEHAESLKGLAQDQAIAEELIKKMVESSLYLECLLLELNDQIPSEQRLAYLNGLSFEALIEANVVRHAEVVVLEESRSKLTEVMMRLSELQDGFSDHDVGDELHLSFSLVSGAAELLCLTKAADVAKRCLQFLKGDNLSRVLDDASSMSLLADVIVSLDYYLDNCRWDKEFDTAVLAVADESLEALSSQ